MQKLKMHSPDLTQANIDKIAALFPSVVAETLDADGRPTRAIDFDLLRQELSDHIVEGPQERYQLDWPGKRAAAFAANAPIAKTLRPFLGQSVDFENTKNLFIEGDNLDALKLLQESYLGKFKFIYLDPPYNTGSDFVYEDDFAESTAEYLTRSGQRSESGDRLVGNVESNGRFHSDWLSMMYPRLRLARRLLSDEGVIISSIGVDEFTNLERLFSHVFGASNQIASVPVVMNLKGNQDTLGFADSHEYLVVWARDRAKCRLGAFPVDAAEVDDWDRDETGPFKRADTLRRTGADASRARRPKGWFPVFVTPERDVYVTVDDLPRSQGDTVLWPINDQGEELSWTWSKQKISDEPHNLIVIDGRSGLNIYKKQRPQLGELATAKPKSVMYRAEYSSSTATSALKRLMGAKVFDNPKPVPLLQDLLKIAAPGLDDLVLDFFAGSASMAEAVVRMNAEDGGRRGVTLVQLAEVVPAGSPAAQMGFANIAELARERWRRAGTAALAGLHHAAWDGDVGFRLLRVDTTNFVDSAVTPEDLVQEALQSVVSNIKPGRSSDDLLFQVLLDSGLELSRPITRKAVDDVEFYSVDDGALVCCFADIISMFTARTIASLRPLRAVFMDSSFADDSQMLNLTQVFREVSPETEIRVI